MSEFFSNPWVFFLTLGLAALVGIMLFRLRPSQPIEAAAIPNPLAPKPVQPVQTLKGMITPVTNPVLLRLMPKVERVVLNAERPLKTTQVTGRLQSNGIRCTRRQVRSCLTALAGNHHTIVRRVIPRGRRRRRVVYAAA